MRRSLATLTLAAAVAVAAAPGASADVGLTGGSTTLKLDERTAAALDGLGVAVKPAGRARGVRGGLRFPVSGGKIDPRSGAGSIAHRGGLRLVAGRTRVTLSRPRVGVGSRQINLSARVGGQRLHVAKLVGRPRISRRGFNTNVRGLRAELTAKAAGALNRAFGVHAFAKGIELGKVVVRTRTDETELTRSGRTSLDLDPGALQALASQAHRPRGDRPRDARRHDGALPDHRRRREARPLDGGRQPLGRAVADQGRHGRAPDGLRHPARGHAQLFAALNAGADKVAILDLDLSVRRSQSAAAASPSPEWWHGSPRARPTRSTRRSPRTRSPAACSSARPRSARADASRAPPPPARSPRRAGGPGARRTVADRGEQSTARARRESVRAAPYC